MKHEIKPFNRGEAFQLFMEHIHWDEPLEVIAKMAVEEAQVFDLVVANESIQTEIQSPLQALRKFGEFVPSGYALYFCSSDGLTVLIADFKTIQNAVDAAIFCNSYLPQVNESYDPAFLTEVKKAMSKGAENGGDAL